MERVVKSPSAQTPRQAYSIENAFPDPADTNVFWAQPLIVAMQRQAELEQFELRPEAFIPYLHGGGEVVEDV